MMVLAIVAHAVCVLPPSVVVVDKKPRIANPELSAIKRPANQFDFDFVTHPEYPLSA